MRMGDGANWRLCLSCFSMLQHSKCAAHGLCVPHGWCASEAEESAGAKEAQWWVIYSVVAVVGSLLSGGSVVVESRGPCCFLWVKLNIVFVSQTDYLDLTQTLFFERALCCFLWVDFCEYLWVKLNTFLGGNWANIWSGIFEEIGFDIEPDFWQWASLRVVCQAEYFFENWVWPLTESYAASCESSWKCF